VAELRSDTRTLEAVFRELAESQSAADGSGDGAGAGKPSKGGSSQEVRA
jgi:hypothetical protein